MNVKAIKYGRIKRQAPDKFEVTDDDMQHILEQLTEPNTAPPQQTDRDKANAAWFARHPK